MQIKRQEYTELESYYKSVEPVLSRTPKTTIENSRDDHFPGLYWKSYL
jgi:hypothetical protein